MAILIQNKGLSGRFKISGNSTGGFKARYVGDDPDVQAFLSRVTVAGGTLSIIERSAINTLVTSLKSAGIWTLMKAIYPMVGASAAACAQNLKSSSFTGIFNGGWTYTSLGATSNGSNTFFNTNFLNQGAWTSTSNGSMGFISRTNQTGTNPCDMGSGTIGTGGDSSTIYSNFAGNFYGGLNCTAVTPGSPNSDTIGFFATSRISSTQYSIYKRGSSTINLTTTDSVGANPNNNIYLGAGNNAGTAQSFSAKQYNFCFIGDGLTQAQIDTYYNILLTFNNSLSR
jgi:hypothetical protein